jgi:hypothetical protein
LLKVFLGFSGVFRGSFPFVFQFGLFFVRHDAILLAFSLQCENFCSFLWKNEAVFTISPVRGYRKGVEGLTPPSTQTTGRRKKNLGCLIAYALV